MLDCLRQRVKVRFLSVFPQAGAENLLKAASEKFEKLKKECNKDALKLHEEHQQANTGTTCWLNSRTPQLFNFCLVNNDYNVKSSLLGVRAKAHFTRAILWAQQGIG